MIKHIVMWRVREDAGVQQIKQAMEAMQGQIPGLLKLEIGIDFSEDPDAADIVLYSEFEDRASLDAYHDHPAHVAVKSLIKQARTERRVVDYETA